MTNEQDNNKQRPTVVNDESVASDKMNEDTKTSTGLDQNIAAMLTYLVGFITGVIFLLIEKDNKFVRYHALQSIIVSASFLILNIVLTAIPFIGWLIGLILAPLYLVLWIYMLIMSYQGKWFKLPFAGDMAEKQLNKMNQNN